MGELIAKDGTIEGWIERIDRSRGELIRAAETGNRVHAAFAQADARADLIESIKNEAIAAKLLRITSPEIGLVELANNPTDDDRVRIAAIALLNGFVPGDDQYAIFGGGRDRDGRAKQGKLYIKENGFRKLFSHLGIVPQVEVGHPEFAALGTNDAKGQQKKIWQVIGRAFCTYRGQQYAVAFSKANPIGLPGYESDNVAGIAAKARRRMLQALWQLVSPVLQVEPIDDDGNELSEVVEPARIESQPELTELQRDRIAVEQQFDRCRSKLQGEQKQLDFFNDSVKSIGEAETLPGLESVGEAMKDRNKEMKLSEQIMQELRRFWSVRKRELQEVAT